MKSFFDDISRIVASPIPRRRAMRLVAGGLAGAALAALGFERPAYAACASGTFACGTKCCNCVAARRALTAVVLPATNAASRPSSAERVTGNAS